MTGRADPKPWLVLPARQRAVGQRAAFSPRPEDPASALEPYRVDQGHGPWDERHAAHLLGRALAGGTPTDVVRLANDPPKASVPWPPARTNLPPARSHSNPRALLFAGPDQARDEAWSQMGRDVAHLGDRRELAAWWLMKLARDQRAPGTRLTLFWHDHFACAVSKVSSLPAMYAQHELFRARGEGPFARLLAGIIRDPAMLRFLDCDSNRRGRPNENLAREVLELFTLGLGAYDEDDIQEGARALTGYTIRRGSFAFVPEHHDPGAKRALGRSVDDGDDFCRAAAEHPACARFLADKLWRWYVSPEPPADVIELLAERWRQHDLDTGWLVCTLLQSRAFYSAEAYRSLVKSPCDYVVSVLRTVSARPDLLAIARACESMGQSLFEPPGVQGWEDGEAWIHAAAWIARCNFAARVARGEQVVVRDAPLEELFPLADRGSPQRALDRALQLFLQDDVSGPARSQLASALSQHQDGSAVRAAVQAVLCLPEFHLS